MQTPKDIQQIVTQGYVFYVEIGSQIVGFASVLKKENALVIEHLYVKPEFRLKRVGAELIEHIFQSFPEFSPQLMPLIMKQ